MNIATILFTYNRPLHTNKVLAALSHNTVLPNKLFIFHDGKKKTTIEKDWNEVETVIHNIAWCDNEIITSNFNKGLADSVSEGVSYVLSKYDAAIVLEDDCVPHPQFMEYMVMALQKYADASRVFSIGASAEPIDVPNNGCDAYFVGRINSCGWGTWKDRWKFFEREYRILGRIKKNSSLSKWLDIWGQDLESTLINNIYGKTDSWAVFWALNVISERGLCLSPYESLVNNIGFDGSGVHSGVAKIDWKERPISKQTKIKLPDKIEVIDDYEILFADYYPWINPLTRETHNRKLAYNLLATAHRDDAMSMWCKRNSVTKICIWGTGIICKELLYRLRNFVQVIGIIVSHPQTDVEDGVKVYRPDNIPKDAEKIIVIPGYDIARIKKMVTEEEASKFITLISFLEYKPLKMDMINATNSNIKTYGSEYGGFSILEMESIELVYSFGLGEDISFSEAIFNKYQPEIWGFAPTPKSIDYINKQSISKNKKFHFEKIGLSDKNGSACFFLPKNEKYVSGSIYNRDELHSQGIEVRMENLNSIANRLNHSKIDILKLDIEGSEFDVIKSIDFTKIDISQICIEIHDRFFVDGNRRVAELDEKLVGNGYVLIAISATQEELTYVKEKLIG